jgi:hypothetical protein
LFGGGVPTISVGPDPSAAPQPGDEEPAPDDEAAPIVACEVATGSGDEPLIDDFEDDDFDTLVQDGRAGSWYWYNSEDDGEAQSFELVADDSAPSGASRVLHSAGGGFEWAGVGLGLRWGYEDDDGTWIECAYDASAYQGVQFWARGSATLRFSASMPAVIPISAGGTCDEVQTPCWNPHAVELELTEQWQHYVLPFTDFVQTGGSLGPLDAASIRTMEFQFEQPADFDLWLDDFSFIDESAPEPDPMDDAPEPTPDVPDASSDDEPSEPSDAGAVELTDASRGEATSADGGS